MPTAGRTPVPIGDDEGWEALGTEDRYKPPLGELRGSRDSSAKFERGVLTSELELGPEATAVLGGEGSGLGDLYGPQMDGLKESRE